jgi:phosphotriesterase-related protein
MKYYLEIQKTGVWLQFDRMGRDKYVPDKIRIDLISQLIKKGFTNQILLGSDMGSNVYWRSYGGSPGLRFLFGTFVKKLAGKGVSPEDITQITEKNPPLALSI